MNSDMALGIRKLVGEVAGSKILSRTEIHSETRGNSCRKRETRYRVKGIRI